MSDTERDCPYCGKRFDVAYDDCQHCGWSGSTIEIALMREREEARTEVKAAVELLDRLMHEPDGDCDHAARTQAAEFIAKHKTPAGRGQGGE